jgi:hypothetical protein
MYQNMMPVPVGYSFPRSPFPPAPDDGRPSSSRPPSPLSKFFVSKFFGLLLINNALGQRLRVVAQAIEQQHSISHHAIASLFPFNRPTGPLLVLALSVNVIFRVPCFSPRSC